MKLTKNKKETIINTSEGDSTVNVYAFNKEGSETYEMDNSRLSIQLVALYSKERRKEASENARKKGLRRNKCKINQNIHLRIVKYRH